MARLPHHPREVERHIRAQIRARHLARNFHCLLDCLWSSAFVDQLCAYLLPCTRSTLMALQHHPSCFPRYRRIWNLCAGYRSTFRACTFREVRFIVSAGIDDLSNRPRVRSNSWRCHKQRYNLEMGVFSKVSNGLRLGGLSLRNVYLQRLHRVHTDDLNPGIHTEQFPQPQLARLQIYTAHYQAKIFQGSATQGRLFGYRATLSNDHIAGSRTGTNGYPVSMGLRICNSPSHRFGPSLDFVFGLVTEVDP